MKKLLILLFALAVLPAGAYEIDAISKDGKMQQMINEVGFRLLNSNKIENRIVFRYEPNKRFINAYASYGGRTVTMGKGLMPFFDDENELAAVLAHEIAHNKDYYDNLALAMWLSPKKYEKKADKKAIDYMVAANYNPIAYIVFMNKSLPQHGTDIFAAHPLVSKRLAYTYEYIVLKYPQYLKNNEYQNNIYYQNFLLNSQENIKKVQTKVNNPNVNVNYK